jgi:hypothetical protein
LLEGQEEELDSKSRNYQRLLVETSRIKGLKLTTCVERGLWSWEEVRLKWQLLPMAAHKKIINNFK